MAAPPRLRGAARVVWRHGLWPQRAFRPNVLDSVEQRQLFSAIGQVKLMDLYYDLFREYNIHIGQVLTMKENFATRNEYLNQRACLTVMLESGVVPIINENDTVSVTELMFTDNDEPRRSGSGYDERTDADYPLQHRRTLQWQPQR